MSESFIIPLHEFLEVWTDFASEVKEAGKKSLSMLMSQNEPICPAGNVFKITVPSEMLKETFNLEKGAFVEKIIQKFSTNKFEIIVQVADNSTDEKQKFLSTPKEKYDHMQHLNPQLKNLMDELGLDFN